MAVPVENVLSTQHCLTIALAFIAITGACATLINSANSKAESLANRIREAAGEHRERNDVARCRQLQEEIELFRRRFRRVQGAQRLLFSTIAIFITSLAIFIILALYIVYFKIPEAMVSTISSGPILVVGICVAAGTLLMLQAIYLQFWEVGKSYATLCIETRDCRLPDSADSERALGQPSPLVSQGTPGLTGAG